MIYIRMRVRVREDRLEGNKWKIVKSEGEEEGEWNVKNNV